MAVLIFDMDGTLVDSMGVFADMAAKIMMDVYACEFSWARQRYRETSGVPFPFQLEILYPGNQKNAEANAQFRHEKLKCYPSLPFFMDTKELKNLSQELDLAVSSNNEQTIVSDKLKEHPWFDLILGYRPNFLKGADHFEEIQNHFEVDRKDMFFVGDSLHDAKVAHEEGISFIARLGTFLKEDFDSLKVPSIRHFGELRSLLPL